MKLTRARLLFFSFFILLLCVGGFWFGSRTGSYFSSQDREVDAPPSENLNHDALRAVARRGFVFEYDMEQGTLENAESKRCTQTVETNLNRVLVHHPVKREMFYVTLQRSIVIPGGTPEQVENYRRLIVESELATSISEKQAIEKDKKRILAGAKVAPIVQASSSPLDDASLKIK